MSITDQRLADLQLCIAEDIAVEYPMLSRDLIAALRELQHWRSVTGVSRTHDPNYGARCTGTAHGAAHCTREAGHAGPCG